MRRKVLVAYIMVLLLTVTAAGYILFVNPGFIHVWEAGTGNGGIGETTQSGQVADGTGAQDGTSADNDISADGEDTDKAIVVSEQIEVENNSPEYELSASLNYSKARGTFLGLQYYSEGQRVEKIFDSTLLPAINHLFENRYIAESRQGYRVKPMILNPKEAQVYFCVIGASDDKGSYTSVYCYDLNSDELRRIFAETGEYSGFSFNKDLSMFAFSYMDDLSSSIYQENSLLQVFDCVAERFTVLNSRNSESFRIGDFRDDKLVYDYIFIKWIGDTRLSLRQRSWEAASGATDAVSETELIYDVGTNKFFNTDGSSIGQEENDGQGPDDTETASLKTLQDFYSYCASTDDYGKAINLLDDAFSLKLNLLAQLGVPELKKEDLDAESVSVYKDILKTTKLLRVIEEDLSVPDNSTCCYLQELNLVEDSPVVMPLIAVLVNSSEGWRIRSITDGDAMKPPFSETQ